HGKDAQDRFAFQGLQWDLPVQVLAEAGYFVLEVNEPRLSDAEIGRILLELGLEHAVSRPSYSLAGLLSAVASLEAAVDELAGRGLVDPARVGISGYSRGGQVAVFAMANSRYFR